MYFKNFLMFFQALFEIVSKQQNKYFQLSTPKDKN